ncbi:hypothetical protein E2C01_100429 [Portunus trituberculatus]|uniref:Uncharacterized protein n=1 Tax=Portunus trituberculatus TaxID=210409 RepID=A0A5B7KDB6_PORTR|nr:hypothetical protein [Portunus trituberculatus]
MAKSECGDLSTLPQRMVDPLLMGALTGRGPDCRAPLPLGPGECEGEGVGSPPARFHPVTALKATPRQDSKMCEGMSPENTTLFNFILAKGLRCVVAAACSWLARSCAPHLPGLL